MKIINKFILLMLTLLLLLTSCTSEKEIVQDDSPITMYVGLGNNKTYYESLKALIKEKLDYDIEFVYTNPIDTSTSVLLMFKNNNLNADIVATAAKTPVEYLKDSCVDLMTCSQIVDYFTYQKAKSFTTDDGSIYQIPFTSRLIGITYNKTLMEEMNYTVPNNYEEMLELKKQCDKDGVTFAVTAMAATGHGFNYLFHLMGAEWISSLQGSKWFDDYLSGKCDSSLLKEKAAYFKKWVDNDLFQNCHYQDWNAINEYLEKRALFFFDLTSGTKYYQNENVNDEFASMPWLSEDGNNNCYTYYDNMYLSLNKKLTQAENKDKLNKCIKILELLTTDEAISLFTSINYDGYAAINNYEISEDRTYFKDTELVNNGFLQDWYYNSFNGETIINTGEVINNYIKDGSNSFDDIFTTMDNCIKDYLNKQYNVLATIDRDLTIKETAILNGEASLLSYGNNADVCLVTYTDDTHPLKPFTQYAIVNNIAYKGDFQDNYIDTIIPAKGQKVFGVNLSGKEINELLATGFNIEDCNYPYLLVGMDNVDENSNYLVLLNIKSISEDIYNDWLAQNKIVLNEDGSVYQSSIKQGFYKYFETHYHIQ